MITRIEISNLGCFDNNIYSIILAPLTFLVGRNNIGKSTFLAAYALNQSGGFNPPLTRFGNFDDAVYSHNIDAEIKITVEAQTSLGQARRTLGISRDRGISISQEGGPAAEELLSLARNTWYLYSDRVQVPREQQIRETFGRLDSQATNTVSFLIEKYTSRDRLWDEAESWLKRIDPQESLLKTPLRGLMGSVQTSRAYGASQVDVNMTYQGAGVQRALQIIAAVVFSPPKSLIVIEEPEMNLHRDSQETLVDLFNKAVNEWEKQIVVTTHAWETIRPIINDIGPGNRRAYPPHVKTDPTRFKMASFALKQQQIIIEDYQIPNKEFRQIETDFHTIWGHQS